MVKSTPTITVLPGLASEADINSLTSVWVEGFES